MPRRAAVIALKPLPDGLFPKQEGFVLVGFGAKRLFVLQGKADVGNCRAKWYLAQY